MVETRASLRMSGGIGKPENQKLPCSPELVDWRAAQLERPFQTGADGANALFAKKKTGAAIVGCARSLG
jgi:hypothetical protein